MLRMEILVVMLSSLLWQRHPRVKAQTSGVSQGLGIEARREHGPGTDPHWPTLLHIALPLPHCSQVGLSPVLPVSPSSPAQVLQICPAHLDLGPGSQVT